MRPGGVEEFIYQFAGYFDLLNETARLRVEFDGTPLPRPPGEFDPDAPAPALFPEELEAFDGTRLPANFRGEQPVPVEFIHDRSFPFNGVPPANNEAIRAAEYRLPEASLQPIPFEAPSFIHVSYSTGGNQAVIEAQQINLLMDNDVAGIGDDELIAALRGGGTGAALDHLVDEANGELPAEFVNIGDYDTSALIDFFTARNAAWKADGDFIKGSVEPGVYLNGVLQPEDAALPVEPDPVEPPLSLGIDDPDDVLPDENEDSEDESGTDGPLIEATEGPQIAEPQEATSSILAPADSPAQTAILGANDIVNGGAIVDVNHATGTMVVFGDYFKTDIIAQVVAYADDDEITHAGAGAPDFETGGNQAYNIAQFLETDPGVGSFAGTGIFAGSDWNVDIFYGDLYDVRSLDQKIWLEDNDISFQDNEQTHYQVLAGANEQGNLGVFNTVIANYDLVLVMGDYNQANVVVQKIVLLDPDTLKVLGSTEIPQDGTGAAASTGGNWLLNDATIENYSTSVINPVTVDWQNLADDLLSETERLELEAGMGIPNFGDGTLDVLLVTGSMYDLNLISQEIVIADADTAMQMLSGDADGVAQSAILGSNHLTNTATIISTGPAADFYVGGDVYDEELLINAEIIASDDDDIVHGDPSQLASELVAFAGPSAGEDDDNVGAFSPQTGAGQADVLGGTIG